MTGGSSEEGLPFPAGRAVEERGESADVMAARQDQVVDVPGERERLCRPEQGQFDRKSREEEGRGWMSLQVPREAAGYVEAVAGGGASRPMRIDESTELFVRMGMPVKQHGPTRESCPDDGPGFPEPPRLWRNVARGRTASTMSLDAEGEEE